MNFADNGLINEFYRTFYQLGYGVTHEEIVVLILAQEIAQKAIFNMAFFSISDSLMIYMKIVFNISPSTYNNQP